MTKKSTGIIVLGMHRAGTSLVTGLVAKLGFDVPGELMPAARDNPKGFWENREVVDVHDTFLGAIGRSWADARPMDAGLFSGVAADRARARLEALLESDFWPRSRWLLKDPRMCRLMPLWGSLLERPGLEVRYVHVLRSPVDVAHSLAARDGVGLERSLALWLRHNLEAERWTRSRDRIWIELEQFERNPESVLSTVTEWLRNGKPPSTKRITDALSAVYDKGLIHHRSDSARDTELIKGFPWIHDAYGGLKGLSRGKGDGRAANRVLDRVWSQVETADGLLFGDPAVFLNDLQRDGEIRLQGELVRLQQLVEVKRAEIDAQRREINDLRSLIKELPGVIETGVAGSQEPLHEALTVLDGNVAKELALMNRVAKELDTVREKMSSAERTLEDARVGISESLDRTGNQEISDQVRVLADANATGLTGLGARLDAYQGELTELIRSMLDQAKSGGDDLDERLESAHAKLSSLIRRNADRTTRRLGEMSERMEGKNLKLLERSLAIHRGIETEMMESRALLQATEAAHERSKSRVGELETELLSARRGLARIEEELQGRSEMCGRLESETRRQGAQLAYMTESWSWRWTAPLRWVRKAMRLNGTEEGNVSNE